MKKIKKRYIILFVSTVFCLIIINCSGLLKPSPKSPYGTVPLLDNPPWHLTKEALLKSQGEPIKIDNDRNHERYLYKTVVMNNSADVFYMFSNGRLDCIRVYFYSNQWPRDKWDAFMLDLKNHLISTSGYKNYCDKYIRSLGNDFYVTALWRNGTNHGELFAKPPGYGDILIIMFDSTSPANEKWVIGFNEDFRDLSFSSWF